MWASRYFARSPAAVGLFIRFLFIGSRLCSTLLSDPASRRRPCASLSLHLHQVVKRTFTSKLSNMLGTQKAPVFDRRSVEAMVKLGLRQSVTQAHKHLR